MKIFKSKEELRELNNKGFALKNKYYSFKNKKFDCLYLGCEGKAVNSHTISEKSSLKYISEDNELLCYEGRRSNDDSITPKITRVGLQHATTFKGYCEVHDEKLFKTIDLNGIKTKNDLILQIYRNISYSNYKCGISKVIDDFMDEKRFNYLKEKFKQLSDEELKKIINDYKDNKFKRNIALKELLDKYTKFVKKLNNESEKLSDDKIFKLKELNMRIFFKKINMVIPVALMNDLGFAAKGKIKNWFFSVIPDENSTNIIMVADNAYAKWAKNLWMKYTKNKIGILNLVEIVMMQSEQWCIKPSVIENMTDDKRRFLEEDMRYINERLSFSEYDISIFDELRESLVSNMSLNIKKKELKKINSMPIRDTKYKREQNFDKYIDKMGLW